MKKTLIFIASLLVIALGCVFAFTAFANNECEHTDNWVVSVGSEGLLGEINFANICPSCGVTVASESYACMFDTLGYSYSDNGGITQHYGVDRDVVARYEELTGETVKFGIVTATRNHVAGNPINSNGKPVSNKVVAVDFTDTVYDVFDVIVTGIPEGNFDNTEIICCAYVIVNGEVSYIDSDAQVKNAPAYTFNKVKQNHTNGVSGTTDVEAYKVVNGERYRALTDAELGLAIGGYWNSTDANYKYITKTKTGADLAAKFAYTPHLTKDSLPNGAIITIESGWQYRPEGWVNGAKNTSRPGNVTTSTVLVNDAWWGEYTTRAFNISKTSNSIIYGNTTVEDISNIFNVYVPVSAEIPANPIPLKQAWDEDGSLKILTIGNSYSDDAMEYVYNIAKELGIEDVEVANLRANSCSLAIHLSNAQNDTGYYMYRHWANGDNKWVDDGSWSSNGTYKISTAVTDADWDYIVFQQVSSSSTDASTYDDLNALIEIVEELNPTARYAWHMTWSNRNDTSASTYASIVSAVQSKIVGNEKIDVIIPVGTTIQNARTSYLLESDPTDATNKVLTRDGWSHLSYGLGRYAAGLTFVKALTGISIDNIEYIPTADTEGHTFNYTNVDKAPVIEAVNNAIANPFAVTSSELVKEEVQISGLVEVEYLGLNKYSYFDSTNTDFTFEALTSEKLAQSAGINEYQHYFSTKMFSKEMLPVGSMIYIADGWTYRPEGWVDSETANTERPAEVADKYVVVTEEWWGDYTVRAFNIRKNGSGSQSDWLVSQTDDDIKAIFKIYVPSTAVDANAEGSESEPVPTNPAFEEVLTFLNNDGKVRKEVVTGETVTLTYTDVLTGETITGQYQAITFESMGMSIGFYNSTSGSWVSTSRTSWVATKLFTKQDLANGMVIWANGTYRPEGWFDINQTTTERNENVSTNGSNAYTVSDAWWHTRFTTSGYTTLDTSYEARGFNITRQSNSTPEQTYEFFKIYVPVDMIEGYVAE